MGNSATAAVEKNGQGPETSLRLVVLASSLGTAIEWYDFFIYGSLAPVLALKFFPPNNETFALIAYLATFAIGFVVRPFGALFFGRMGDLIGRKYAFLITLSIMGGSTALIGAMPTYASAGWLAPVTLIAIRTLQGLALGGEYGGAAVYVGEYAPDRLRGYYTSFIQLTAVVGLCVSLLVIIGTQSTMSKEAFAQWGWRIPFLVSLLLVVVSLYIRLKLQESPIFLRMKNRGETSKSPLREAFTKWANLKQVLISLFGATAGQGVVVYTGQFYALFYMQTILKIDGRTANILEASALFLSIPLITLFGALSDHIGRKKIMVAGFTLAALTFLPIYHGMQHAAGNDVIRVESTRNPVTRAISLTPMTVDNSGAIVPAKNATNPNRLKIAALIFLQMIYVGMVYGPIAAYLVEAFPAKIRYTSLSLPYHIGNGIFGGVLPLVGLSLCALTNNIYAGLYYPIAVAGLAAVVGSLMLPETHTRQVADQTIVAAK
jgi:MFS family permease